MQRKYNAAFVPPHPRSWLARMFDSLFGRQKVERVRTPPTPPLRQAQGKLVPIYAGGMPGHVWDFKKRASDAISLLRLMVEGKPASRRAWLAMGRSDRRWRQARRVLINAKVLDRDGELLYGRRDAQLRLAVYLDAIERKCWESGRYVAP